MRKFKNLKPGQAHTLETIHERTVEEGDCWIWQAGKSHGTPALRHNGKTIQVRTYIFVHLMGRQTNGRMVSMKCDNLDCVNPDHIILVTRTQLQQRTARRTQYGRDPVRNAKIAMAKQKASPLTLERVREIRNMEGTMRSISRQTGICFSVVQRIRNGTSWREAANPFAGLY